MTCPLVQFAESGHFFTSERWYEHMEAEARAFGNGIVLTKYLGFNNGKGPVNWGVKYLNGIRFSVSVKNFLYTVVICIICARPWIKEVSETCSCSHINQEKPFLKQQAGVWTSPSYFMMTVTLPNKLFHCRLQCDFNNFNLHECRLIQLSLLNY